MSYLRDARGISRWDRGTTGEVYRLGMTKKNSMGAISQELVIRNTLKRYCQAERMHDDRLVKKIYKTEAEVIRTVESKGEETCWREDPGRCEEGGAWKGGVF